MQRPRACLLRAWVEPCDATARLLEASCCRRKRPVPGGAVHTGPRPEVLAEGVLAARGCQGYARSRVAWVACKVAFVVSQHKALLHAQLLTAACGRCSQGPAAERSECKVRRLPPLSSLPTQPCAGTQWRRAGRVRLPLRSHFEADAHSQLKGSVPGRWPRAALRPRPGCGLSCIAVVVTAAHAPADKGASAWLVRRHDQDCAWHPAGGHHAGGPRAAEHGQHPFELSASAEPSPCPPSARPPPAAMAPKAEKKPAKKVAVKKAGAKPKKVVSKSETYKVRRTAWPPGAGCPARPGPMSTPWGLWRPG